MFAVLILAVPAFGQSDDIYYNPDTDSDYYGYNNQDYSNSRAYANRGRSSAAGDRRQEIERYYDADQYDYYNDYDFYYTSRIRRFHRPVYGFGFYDPVYVDAFYYDPFVVPGNTILIYDDFFSYRDWVRWSRWRNWGWNSARFNRWDWCFAPGFNNFGWGGFGFNRWFNPGFSINIGIGFNNFGWGGFGFNRWGWGGNPWFNAYPGAFWGGNRWAGNYNWHPAWGNGFDYNRDVYYGPRTGGSAIGPAAGNRNRQNQVRPGTFDGTDRLTDNPRDININNRDRATTTSPERIRTGRVGTDTRDRAIRSDRNRTMNTDRNTRVRQVEPQPRTPTRTRGNTTTDRSRATRSSGNNVEQRRLGGQIVPINPTPQSYDRMERYRRPSRSGSVQERPRESSSSYPSFDRNRGTRSYPNFNRSSRDRSGSSINRGSSSSRSQGSSIRSRGSSTRSSAGRSRGSSSSRSRSSSGGRSRGGGNG